jgi:N-acyl homoserine lactone hydrolase
MPRIMARSLKVSVTPIVVAHIQIVKAVETYNTDFDRKLWVPVFIYKIDGFEDGPVIVDSGLCNPGKDGCVAGARIKGGRAAAKLALKQVGVNPASVKTLILTHLHIDHLSNFDLFANANIIVQKKELKFAFNPIATQHHVFNPRDLGALENANLQLVDGDKRILKGLGVIHVPGHTPGTQAVRVHTEKGEVVICSDSVPMYHNWYPHDSRFGSKSELDRIPPGIHVDVDSCLRSMTKIAAVADIILPSHDPLVKDRIPLP